jgi:hypothetical protein
MTLPGIIQRNITRITTVTTLLSGLVFGLTLVSGMPQVSRIAALFFSLSATAEIIDSSATPRPRGTAMVSVAAFLLIMEGGAAAISEGMDKASFIEIGIGLYLMATLWTLLRR